MYEAGLFLKDMNGTYHYVPPYPSTPRIPLLSSHGNGDEQRDENQDKLDGMYDCLGLAQRAEIELHRDGLWAVFA